jgi:hypothetical protein
MRNESRVWKHPGQVPYASGIISATARAHISLHRHRAAKTIVDTDRPIVDGWVEVKSAKNGVLPRLERGASRK